MILAGGRSRRLGGSPKALLVRNGTTLLRYTVETVVAAGIRSGLAVVGPEELRGQLDGTGLSGLVPVLTRESPAFSGPAAAVVAGLSALDPLPAHVLVLACDMPRIGSALPALLAAAGSGHDGVLAVDAGRPQQLVAVYRTAPLVAAGRALAATGALANAPVRSLIASLDLGRAEVPPGSTADVDSWPDAHSFGIRTVPA